MIHVWACKSYAVQYLKWISAASSYNPTLSNIYHEKRAQNTLQASVQNYHNDYFLLSLYFLKQQEDEPRHFS